MLALLPIPPPAVWRSYEEVFDLAADGGAVCAATNGGLLRREGGAWKAVPSPSGLRAIEGTRPLVVLLSDGRRLRWEKGAWRPAPHVRDSPNALDPARPWPGGNPPPAHAYAKLNDLAGTVDGLYRLKGGRWARERLPSALPLSRPNGVALLGSEYVVGGLGGLFVGRPGGWKRVSEASIRQVVASGGAVWAVHGDGAVDRVEPGRLFPDVLSGTARRPWSSCASPDGALLGGLGGWWERGGERYPPEIAGDVVTALLAAGEARWVGTQKTGLFRFSKGETRRWNPGNGLPDVWVTALLATPKGLVVGTARRGLFRVVGDRASPLPSPTLRVAALALWSDRLVVGGMDGAWIQKGNAWAPLATGGEETTALAVLGGGLAVATAAGVHFVSHEQHP